MLHPVKKQENNKTQAPPLLKMQQKFAGDEEGINVWDISIV